MSEKLGGFRRKVEVAVLAGSDDQYIAPLLKDEFGLLPGYDMRCTVLFFLQLLLPFFDLSG